MRCTRLPFISAMTWRERSTSTCLPCDGYLGLNNPRRASRPRTTGRDTLATRLMPRILR